MKAMSNLAGIPPAYHRDEHDIVSMSGSEDLSAERDLVEEIQLRTAQFPLTKQDSYANAIYSAAAKQQQKRLRKQGSYEAAVETGVKKQAAIKRTKEIMQIRKQASRIVRGYSHVLSTGPARLVFIDHIENIKKWPFVP